MPYQFDVPMPDGSVYPVKRLLSDGEDNTKTAKSNKASDEYITHSVSMAPSRASGFNLCPSASPGCIASCLYTSGLAGVFPRTIQPARIAKARMLKLYKREFVDRLTFEVDRANRRATKLGKKLAVRLNVLSDIQWEREVPELFVMFSDVTFYDYTKIFNRMLRYVVGDFPTNYDLTFSRSETNEHEALSVLERGGNVAIPFKTKKSEALPTTWKGFEVYNADTTDLRFLDPKGGKVAGLAAKGKARFDTTGFVVDPRVN